MRPVAFDGFVLDVERRSLLAAGKTVKLQAKAFDLLAFLVAMRHRPVGRDELLAGVWHGLAVAETNLTVQMSNLRRALADHGGADLIITLPNRSYRFVGAVIEQEAAPCASDAKAAARQVWTWSARVVMAALAGAVLAGAIAGLAASSGWPIAATLPAHVRVETFPDEVYIPPGGFHYVDYRITALDAVDLQLESEDWQFVLRSGEFAGAGLTGGRIYKGSFPIAGGTTGIYHNNIYLIPKVAALVRAAGENVVQLRHIFHLREPRGREISVPAILMIHLDPVPGIP